MKMTIKKANNDCYAMYDASCSIVCSILWAPCYPCFMLLNKKSFILSLVLSHFFLSSRNVSFSIELKIIEWVNKINNSNWMAYICINWFGSIDSFRLVRIAHGPANANIQKCTNIWWNVIKYSQMRWPLAQDRKNFKQKINGIYLNEWTHL